MLVFRTTTFKLTLLLVAVFALFAIFMLGYFAWNTSRLITAQIRDTVDAEIADLTEQYQMQNFRELVVAVDSRAHQPGANLYLLTSYSGEALAGNIGALAPGVLDRPGWTEAAYRRIGDTNGGRHRALVRVEQLPGGFRLLVGRDLAERERLVDIVFSVSQWLIA